MDNLQKCKKNGGETRCQWSFLGYGMRLWALAAFGSRKWTREFKTRLHFRNEKGKINRFKFRFGFWHEVESSRGWSGELRWSMHSMFMHSHVNCAKKSIKKFIFSWLIYFSLLWKFYKDSFSSSSDINYYLQDLSFFALVKNKSDTQDKIAKIS